MSVADRQTVKAAVVNGSRGSSVAQYNVNRMKSGIGSHVSFVQDNSSEDLTAQLSNNDYSAKDDILILDSQGRVVEYFEAKDSGLYGDNNKVFTAVKAMADGSYKNPCAGEEMDVDECAEGIHDCDANADCMNTKDQECTLCNTGYKLQNGSCISDLPKVCDMQDSKKARGKKKRMKKMKTACACHDACKDAGGHAAYMFQKLGLKKNGKPMKTGKCICVGGDKKGRARYSKKLDDRFVSGTIA